MRCAARASKRPRAPYGPSVSLSARFYNVYRGAALYARGSRESSPPVADRMCVYSTLAEPVPFSGRERDFYFRRRFFFGVFLARYGYLFRSIKCVVEICKIVTERYWSKWIIFLMTRSVNARRIVGQSHFTCQFQIDQSQSLEVTTSSPSLFCIGILNVN